MRRYVCAASLLFSLQCAPGQSQQPPQTNGVERDPQAISVIQQSIISMGGAKVIAQVQTVIAQGSIEAFPGTAGPTGSVVIEDQFSTQVHEFRDSFRSGSLTQDFTSGHGSPGVVSNGHGKRFSQHMANFRLPVHLPMLILAAALANPNCNITLAGQTTVSGQRAVQVHLHVDTDVLQQTLSIQDWYFDPTTGLPLRVEYRLPDASNTLFFVNATSDFSDFRPVQGILFPFQTLSYQDGKPKNVLLISSVALNQSIVSTDFDPPVAVAQ